VVEDHSCIGFVDDGSHESPLTGMGTDSIGAVSPYPGLADDDEAPREGRWREFAEGANQESMRRHRGEARLAADESRFVILRAERVTQRKKQKGKRHISDNEKRKHHHECDKGSMIPVQQ
jgi:hypothetical protein